MVDTYANLTQVLRQLLDALQRIDAQVLSIDLLGTTLVATAIEATPAETVYVRPEADVLEQLAALAAEAG
ncbi:hypothetical protein ACWEO2_18315 [Nocardia sp. NPDC004278]